jgi:hypothetical protein
MGTVPVQSAILQIREELAVTNRVNIWTPNGDLDVAVSWTAFKLWRRQTLAPKRSDGDLTDSDPLVGWVFSVKAPFSVK